MAYNPYDDINSIYENKKKYNEAKAGGQNYAAYADAAQKYYTNLSNNGYADVADQLTKSTEEQAADLMRKYSGATSTGTGAAPTFPTQIAANNASSAYSGITPEISKLVTNILGAKGRYNEALASGSGAEGKIASDAQAYYNQLTGAGRSDISDLLSKSDYTTALNYLNSIGSTGNTASADTQAALSQLNQLIGAGGESRVDYDKYNQNAQNTLNYVKSLLQPSAQDSAAQAQTQNNLQSLYGTVVGNNSQYNAQSQALLDQIAKYASDQTARYDDFYGWQKDTNPHDTDMAKSIMNYYNMLGGNAAGNATATEAGANAGNIDSYAAANANRQQLAYTNAGTNAVNQQHNTQVANMLATLQSLGVDVGGAQDRQIGLVQGNQAYNADLLNNYTTGAGDLNANITARQTSRGNNLTDALSQITGLHQTDSSNASNDYANQLQAALNAYNIGATSDMSRDANTTNLAQQYLLNQQNREGLASNERIAESENERLRYLGELQVERDRYIAQGDWENALKTQQLINQGNAAVASYNAGAARYDADTSLKIAEANAKAAQTAQGAAQTSQAVNDNIIAEDFIQLYNNALSKRLSAAGPGVVDQNSRKSLYEKEAWLEVERAAKAQDNLYKAQYGTSTTYHYDLYKIAKETIEKAAEAAEEAALLEDQ